MNDQQKQQIAEQIKTAKHVLVTVSTNPTVDELAASIGLTLAINKMDKHATTVFSGHVPSTIQFLQPENTIETTTDSLRDFIIALDKSKADKLRYKVEDDVVRIFITPYRTTITDKDLDFSQGDFNVDLVIGLGITKRQDLDTAITAHGRILHDATIVALTKHDAVSELGSINWQDTQASSLCEMVASVVMSIQPEVVDGQMATAFLTGIIAETDRFKNEKTTPIALSLSSQLMSAGANQQLIAEKLDEPEPTPQVLTDEFSVSESQPQQRPDGELEIDHSDDQIDKIHIDDHGNLNLTEDVQEDNYYQNPEQPESQNQDNQQYQDQTPQVSYNSDNDNLSNNEEILPPLPPQPDIPEILHRPKKAMGENNDVDSDLLGDLTSQELNEEDRSILDQPESSHTPMMEHQRVVMPPVHPDDVPKSDKPFDLQEALNTDGVLQRPLSSTPAVTEMASDSDLSVPVPTEQQASPKGDSLADLEKSIGSPHVASSLVVEEEQSQLPPPDLDVARDTVLQAANSVPPMFPTPSESIGAHPISLEPPMAEPTVEPIKTVDSNAPPPVPPPMTPQFYDADGNNANPFLNPHA